MGFPNPFKKVQAAMRNANVADYKRGVKKLTSGLDNRGPIPTKLVAETALRVPAVFGRTVEAVRLPMNSGVKSPAAIGAAGSAGLFGQAVFEAGGAVKDTVAYTPKPVREVLEPVVGFAAGVASVPLAARYAPGQAAGFVMKHPVATTALVGGTAAGLTAPVWAPSAVDAVKAKTTSAAGVFRAEPPGNLGVAASDPSQPPSANRGGTRAKPARRRRRKAAKPRKLGRKNRRKASPSRKGKRYKQRRGKRPRRSRSRRRT